MEYCKNKDGILCYLRAIQGHSGGIPIEPELMGYVKIPPKDFDGTFSPYWEKD